MMAEKIKLFRNGVFCGLVTDSFYEKSEPKKLINYEHRGITKGHN